MNDAERRLLRRWPVEWPLCALCDSTADYWVGTVHVIPEPPVAYCCAHCPPVSDKESA